MAHPWITSRFPTARAHRIEAGWSDDDKFRLESAEGITLLRISPAAAYERKQAEFTQVARLHDASPPSFPAAVEHGLSPDGTHCFVRYTWLEGTPAREVVASWTEEARHQLGREAGRLLRLAHSLPQTLTVDSHALIARKIEHRAREMREQNLEFPGYATMLAYLQANLDRLRDTPTCYRHGDYHLGNLLVTNRGDLRVIDFNRSDFGDPGEDFNRLFTFSRQICPAFARGQIQGYFDGDPPDGFFAHALIYVLMDAAFGLLWARRFGDREVAVQHALIEQVMGDFNHLKTDVPRWWTAHPSAPPVGPH